MRPELIKTIDFPTDIVEEEWATVRLYELAGNVFGMLVWPTDVDEDRRDRLEQLAIGLYTQGRREGAFH